MSYIYGFTLFILLVSLIVGVMRIIQGPRQADRLLAAQLFGTTGVAILVILAELQPLPAARDTALVLALLAMLAAVAFVSRVWKTTSTNEDH